MIRIGIDPVAFTFGAVEVRWYSIMMVAAIILIVTWTIRSIRKTQFSTDLIYILAVWGIVGGLLGARMVAVVDQFHYYRLHPSEIAGLQGLAIYGAILGASAAVWIASKVHGFSFAPLADLVAPGALLAQAVGRIGCTINGCCYGGPTSLPWGFTYTHPNSLAPLYVSTHPAVVYEMVLDLALFAFIWVMRGRLRPAGSLFLLYLTTYSIGRFFVAMSRDPSSQGPLFFGWFMGAQLISLAVLAVSIPLLAKRTRLLRKQTG